MDIILILFLFLGAWLWYDAVQAKEVATIGAKLRCDTRGIMLLDQTVMLKKVRLRRARSGLLRPLYTYGFEYTQTGDDRSEGTITVMGGHVLSASFDESASPPSTLH